METELLMVVSNTEMPSGLKTVLIIGLLISSIVQQVRHHRLDRRLSDEVKYRDKKFSDNDRIIYSKRAKEIAEDVSVKEKS